LRGTLVRMTLFQTELASRRLTHREQRVIEQMATLLADSSFKTASIWYPRLVRSLHAVRFSSLRSSYPPARRRDDGQRRREASTSPPSAPAVARALTPAGTVSVLPPPTTLASVAPPPLRAGCVLSSTEWGRARQARTARRPTTPSRTQRIHARSVPGRARMAVVVLGRCVPLSLSLCVHLASPRCF
jgi:hypothetical protein